jgi:hypothetical protein
MEETIKFLCGILFFYSCVPHYFILLVHLYFSSKTVYWNTRKDYNS